MPSSKFYSQAYECGYYHHYMLGECWKNVGNMNLLGKTNQINHQTLVINYELEHNILNFC